MKKIMLMSLLCMSAYVHGMEVVDYDHFIRLCKQGRIDLVKAFIQQNPTIDINCQDEHGTTPVLHAATKLNWSLVWYLLETYGANKMLSDNYGQTIFSMEIYIPMGEFKKLLKLYSLDELNILCKTMCLNEEQSTHKYVAARLLTFLGSGDDINAQDGNGWTALHNACHHKIIPLITKLLERGADLDIKTASNESAYDQLNYKFNRAPLFVVREAFNSGPCVPAALIRKALKNKFVPDVAHYIKQLYVAEKLSEKPFESPKARIWKPVCKDACEILKIDSTDEKRCLTTVLLLPQRKLTDVNIQLALADK